MNNLKSILDQGFIYGGLFGNVELPPGEHWIAIPLYLGKYVEGGLEFVE